MLVGFFVMSTIKMYLLKLFDKNDFNKYIFVVLKSLVDNFTRIFNSYIFYQKKPIILSHY